MNANVKRVLLFGAGMVSKPVVIYFSSFPGYSVTVVANDHKAGEALVKDFKGKAEFVLGSVEDKELCLKLVKSHDIVLSLLPASFHPIVADYCLQAGKNMTTSSYISPELEKNSTPVIQKGLTFLNECGLDPGIDHVVTLKMIEEIRRKGGRIRSLYSYCGGLITPDCIDNPLGYKFSWSPLGVFRALNNNAKYLKDGKVVTVPGKDLLYNAEEFNVNNALNIVRYPNRDSLKYKDLYGIPEAEDVYRGTFRYKGFCEIIAAFKDLGLLQEIPVTSDRNTWRKMLNGALGQIKEIKIPINYKEVSNIFEELTRPYPNSINHEKLLSKITEHPIWKTLSKDKIIDRIKLIAEGLAYFNLLDDSTILDSKKTYLENFLDRAGPLMQLSQNDSDSVIMTIIIEAVYDKTKIVEDYKFQMIVNGEKGGLSAMAKTVGLPLAIASKLILDGKITRTGVIGPFTSDVYSPIYDELVKMKLISQYNTRHFKPKL
jgi:saccharopine dehydrogenase-like NADP-dependent oxidoreductase